MKDHEREVRQVKLRMRIPISGSFHGYRDVKRGDVVEVDDENGARYCRLGYAQTDLKGELGQAYSPSA
jgi:hypothetical protein